MSYDMHLHVARFEQLIIRLDDGTMTMLSKSKLTLTCLFQARDHQDERVNPPYRPSN